MKSNLLCLLAAGTALLWFCGCKSVETVEDTRPTVPDALNDPEGFSSRGGDGFGVSGVDKSGPWVDAAALAGNPDNWVEVDPQNRLGMPIIYFAYDSDVLVPSETANLDKIAEYLGKNTSLMLVIQGHCDNRGTDEYNRALGERRANAIRAYLASKGVAENRMKTQSFGKDKPAVPGTGESIWRQNRRGVPVPMKLR